MSLLSGKLADLRRCVGMADTTPYRHYAIDPKLPIHVYRAVCQTEYAFRLSLTRGGKYDGIVEQAADLMLEAIARDHVLTPEAARKAEELLLPLGDEAKQYTVHAVGHAHIDMNWMWPYHETAAVALETFRTMLKLMEEYPEFTFAQSQASTYRIVEELEPELLDQIRARVREGRWELSASTWVEADKNMPSEESMARHLLYTKQYLSKLFGIDPATLDLDYEPDTFGHSANVPQILNDGGVKYYYHCRGHEGEPIFRWRSPSGGEVISYCEPTWYLGDLNPSFALFVPELCEKYGIRDALKVYGVGDHGGGPTRRDLSWICEMQTWPVWPTIRFSSYRAFYRALEEARDRLPVVEGEMNFVFTGCYTTQSRIKASNRTAEALLGEAEAISCAAKDLTGRPVKTDVFAGAWKKTLFNQFHDILTGSGVRDTREYALGQFQTVMAAAGTEYSAAMRAIAARIDTSSVQEKGADQFGTSEGAGVGFGSDRFRPPVAERGMALTRVFHLFNPDPFPRRVPTELEVWDWQGDLRRISMRTPDGTSVPMQVLLREHEAYWDHDHMRILADLDVPAFGWATAVLDQEDTLEDTLDFPKDPRVHMPDEFVLDNGILRAEFDVITGQLRSLKKQGTELLRAPAGFLEILEDTDKGMTSWIVGRYITRKAPEKMHITKGDCGPIRQSVILKCTLFGGSELTCEVILDARASALAFRTTVDWKEAGNEAAGIPQLAFSAPLAAPFDSFLCDIPGGLTVRKNVNLDLPVQTFAASLPECDSPCAVLGSDTKYGIRAWNNELQMTLIRAGFEPDPYPERGLHAFTVYLGAADRADAPSLVRSLCRAPGFLSVRPHQGDLPAEGSFLTASLPEGARITAVKESEDGTARIIRIASAADGFADLGLPFAPAEAAISDACEHALAALPVKGSTVIVPLKADTVISVRISR